MVNDIPMVTPVKSQPAATITSASPATFYGQIVKVQQSQAVICSTLPLSAGCSGRAAIEINQQLLKFALENWPKCKGRSKIERVRKLLRMGVSQRPSTGELQNVLNILDSDPPAYHTIRSALIEFDQNVDSQVMMWVEGHLQKHQGTTYRDTINNLMLLPDKPTNISVHSLRPALTKLLGPEVREISSYTHILQPAAARRNDQMMAWVSSNWSQIKARSAEDKLVALLQCDGKPQHLSLITLYPAIKKMAGAQSLRKVDIRQALIRANIGAHTEIDRWTKANWFRVPQGHPVSKILAMLALPQQPDVLNPALLYAALSRLLGVNCPCFSTVGDAFRLHKHTGILTPEILLWITGQWNQTQHSGSQLTRILLLLRANPAFELDEVMLFRALQQLEPDYAPSQMSVVYAFSLFRTKTQFTPVMQQWVMHYWPRSAGLPVVDRVDWLLNNPGKPEGLNSRLLFGVLLTTESELPDWHSIRNAWITYANQKVHRQR